MKLPSTDDKPAVDKASLQQLLSAAYVVQQHNERLQTGQPPETGYSQILKEILEVQEQLRSSPLDAREKSALIARRARQMTQASGSAVGIVEGGELEYYAASGSAARQAGARMPPDSSLVAECLRTGYLLQSAAAETDPRLSLTVCRSLGVKALIAVAVKHEGRVAGVLELHFAQANSFHEQDIRTCQLMSALVGEAILKSPMQAGGPFQQTAPPPEPSNTKDKESLLAALEKIRPKLERLAKNPGMASLATPSGKESVAHSDPASLGASFCRGCGHPMTEDELFCGLCGSPRQTRRIWSSLWQLQRKAERLARENSPEPGAAGDAFDDPLDVFPSELEEIIAGFSGEPFEETLVPPDEVPPSPFAEALVSEQVSPPDQRSDEENTAPDREQESAVEERSQFAAPAPEPADPAHDAGRLFLMEKSRSDAPPDAEGYPPFSGFASDTSLLSLANDSSANDAEQKTSSDSGAKPEGWSPSGEASSQDPSRPWGSATKTKEWLEVQRDNNPWLAKKWQQQRANIYLVAAGLLLVAVLLGWGAPSKPVAASGRAAGVGNAHRQEITEQPDLTLSEKLLIDLGLAEAPPVVVAEPGNPDTQVWIDVHTALYYCPGADLYGKTPGGRTTSQREAQQDQFQPALRKACQ